MFSLRIDDLGGLDILRRAGWKSWGAQEFKSSVFLHVTFCRFDVGAQSAPVSPGGIKPVVPPARFLRSRHHDVIPPWGRCKGSVDL